MLCVGLKKCVVKLVLCVKFYSIFSYTEGACIFYNKDEECIRR